MENQKPGEKPYARFVFGFKWGFSQGENKGTFLSVGFTIMLNSIVKVRSIGFCSRLVVGWGGIAEGFQ